MWSSRCNSSSMETRRCNKVNGSCTGPNGTTPRAIRSGVFRDGMTDHIAVNPGFRPHSCSVQPSAPLGRLRRSRTGRASNAQGEVLGWPAELFAQNPPVDAWLPPATPGGCLGWLLKWFSALLRALFGNVLGDTDERLVQFDGAGNSGLMAFALINHKLKTSGVGIRTTDWKWQFWHHHHWHDFGTTQHKIYLVLDMPAGPWNQNTAGNNLQLPWTDALDKACFWALGATTKDQCAERVTTAINAQPNQSYTPATMFVDFGTDSYKLSSYLSQLTGGAPFQLNCTDCADAVTTFSNLLGCDLYEGRFFNMVTRTFFTLNGNPTVLTDWVSWTWGYHEICWLHQIGQSPVLLSVQPHAKRAPAAPADYIGRSHVYVPGMRSKLFCMT